MKKRSLNRNLFHLTKNIVIRYNISLLWMVRMFLYITCIFIDFSHLIFLQHTQISSLIIQFKHAVTQMTLETKYGFFTFIEKFNSSKYFYSKGKGRSK